MSNLENVVVLPWHDLRRKDGIIPTLCTSSSLWLFAMGREVTGAQLVALFGHTSDSKFGGLTEKGVIGLLGNSMHLAEVLYESCHVDMACSPCFASLVMLTWHILQLTCYLICYANMVVLQSLCLPLQHPCLRLEPLWPARSSSRGDCCDQKHAHAPSDFDH